MTDTPISRRRGRLQLILVALVFGLPLVGAALLYFGGHGWRPAGSSNHGDLLTPIVNLYEQAADNGLQQETRDRWALVYIDDDCAEACGTALHRLRQVRLMLGKDMNRVLRVFLHGETAPDTVLADPENIGLVAREEPAMAELMLAKRPADSKPGGIFLLDPLGNLVLYFPPDILPRDMVDDLSHLLKLSHIG